jgi:hypothetical protein
MVSEYQDTAIRSTLSKYANPFKVPELGCWLTQWTAQFGDLSVGQIHRRGEGVVSHL